MTTIEQFISPGRPMIGGKTVVVVAHPDDEILACGALLGRLSDLILVHVTAGGCSLDARQHGFPGWQSYAEARRRELAAALAIAEVHPSAMVQLALRDQAVAFALPSLSRRLLDHLKGARRVLTHAFEGGHPDHDATAFAVQAALALIRGPAAPQRIEMPFYRAGQNGAWIRQRFPRDGVGSGVLRLSAREQEQKRQAMHAFVSQAATLRAFAVAEESYRPAPVHDFSRPPNAGRILYQRYAWGMNFPRFAALAAAALVELGLAAADGSGSVRRWG